ncbi:MAG: hypothetical protein IPN68_15305 [Bacteroidetes bacterium]|nr:hypothetical protein [Bacteroidota bacterium]
MERIRVIRISSFLTWTLLIIAVTNAVLGGIFLIKNISVETANEGSKGIVNAIFMIIQGGIFIVWGLINLNNRKYYIEWDETEIRLLLPDTKKTETIKFSDIQSVIVRLFEIELKLTEKVRVIDLNTLKSEDLKKVKEMFERIK